MWSNSTNDIRSLRKLARDGKLAIDSASVDLIEASLAVSRVETDSSGNVRPLKMKKDNSARDDVAYCLMLSAGGVDRLAGGRRRRGKTLVAHAA